jgi:nuclease S1
MRFIAVSAALLLASCQSVLGWGEEGHAIVAELAQRRLDAETLKAVKRILGGEVSLASIASWGDDYRAENRDTSGWHFVDIAFERSTYDPAIDCKKVAQGDCIINAIERSRAVFGDCSKPIPERAEALRFIVHFVGDIHQPLHAAERDNDKGGNDVEVTFFGQKTNLHALWDVGLIQKTVFAWGTYVQRLETTWFPDRDIGQLLDGTPVDWALETHRLAREVAYDLPDGRVLEGNYYRKSLPVLDRQLALAGGRLARFLQTALQHSGCS